MTEKEKMLQGLLYDASVDELTQERRSCALPTTKRRLLMRCGSAS